MIYLQLYRVPIRSLREIDLIEHNANTTVLNFSQLKFMWLASLTPVNFFFKNLNAITIASDDQMQKVYLAERTAGQMFNLF